MNDPIDIKALAKLSKIKIADKDLPNMRQDLEATLALCQKMNNISLAELPLCQESPAAQTQLRPDVVSERNRRLQHAPDQLPMHDSYYLVPNIID